MTLRYAIIDDGQPVEVFIGLPFVSKQFKVTTPEEAAWAFSPIGSVIALERHHSPVALGAYDDEDRARYGIHAFALPTPPEGKALTGYTLALEGETVVATGQFADPPVPTEVSRMQAKQALRIAGRLDAVETAIAQASSEVKIYWADAPSFHRDHPTLLAMAAGLGMSSDEVDTLFRAAALIT